MNIREQVSLAPFTTFHIGGPARFLVEARTEEEVREALAYARERELPVAVLGGGSNVLVPDEGIRAMVLRMAMDDISFERGSDAVVTCSAEAGASWDEVVERAVAQQLGGIENLSGIPGTVGGAIVQNIGAYGAVLSDVVTAVDVYDIHESARRTWTVRECGFGYRTSVFKKYPGRYIVLRARLALSAAFHPNISYHDLAVRFASNPSPALAEVRDAVADIRRAKFPDLLRYGTVGSFFLNPVLEEAAARAVTSRFPGMPLFPLPEGGVKVPIAWLLDYRHGVLDMRDMRVGGAFVWPAQPLVIATERGATADDVERLAQSVVARVEHATGIRLEPELGRFLDASAVGEESV